MALASSPMLSFAAGLGNPQVRADEAANTIATELNAVNELNMVGPYGNWLANQVLGDQPGKLSLRSGQWQDIDAWRTAARKRAWECIAPVDPGKTPEVRVDSQHDYDGLHIEHLSNRLSRRIGRPHSLRGGRRIHDHVAGLSAV
jgi:hypothetical protein